MIDLTDVEKNKLSKELFNLIPEDGSSIDNKNLMLQFKSKTTQIINRETMDEDYWLVRNNLLTEGSIIKGLGKGGSVSRVKAVKDIVATKDEIFLPEKSNALKLEKRVTFTNTLRNI